MMLMRRARTIVPGLILIVAIGFGWAELIKRIDEPGSTLSRMALEFKTTEYAPGLRVQVIQPNGTAPEGGWPTVMYFHGGGWAGGGIDGLDAQWVARVLPRSGYAVVLPEYSLTSDGHHFRKLQRDVEQAYRWVLHHAEDYDLDANRLGAMGFSAGGHLAALLAVEHGPPAGYASRGGQIRALVGIGGIYSLLLNVKEPRVIQKGDEVYHAFSRNSGLPGSYESQLLGAAPSSAPKLARAASPAFMAEKHGAGKPNTLLLHGSEDTVVPFEQSKLFAQTLRKAGAQVVYREARAGHELSPLNNAGKRPLATERAIVNFLNRSLKPQSEIASSSGGIALTMPGGS